MAATILTPAADRAWPVLGLLAALTALGLAAAWLLASEGHHITGAGHHFAWSLPDVCAMFLVLAASGALNVASVAWVFGVTGYRPLAPLSALVAIALLVGGVGVLTLDLGRPDRLLVAMLYHNPASVFGWNSLLYTGFVAVTGVSLWTMLVRRRNRYAGTAALVALLWRLALTTGTGSIYGLLAGREAFHSAMMPPLFIAASLADGLAVFLLVLAGLQALGAPPADPALRHRLGRLLGIFAVAALYFVVALHLTWMYAPESRPVSRFLLVEGGVWPLLFWVGEVFLGTVVPLWLLVRRTGRETLAAALVALGGLAQMAVLVIGGQAFPRTLLPGWDVVSAFGDGRPATYIPALPEALLGLSGFAIALLLVLLGCRLFRILPAESAA